MLNGGSDPNGLAVSYNNLAAHVSQYSPFPSKLSPFFFGEPFETRTDF
jgi:hypothetical protein